MMARIYGVCVSCSTDLDIGKDFLTSWKTMSVTEDDPMDFDFSTVAKGKKKTFNFDDAYALLNHMFAMLNYDVK